MLSPMNTNRSIGSVSTRSSIGCSGVLMQEPNPMLLTIASAPCSGSASAIHAQLRQINTRDRLRIKEEFCRSMPAASPAPSANRCRFVNASVHSFLVSRRGLRAKRGLAVGFALAIEREPHVPFGPLLFRQLGSGNRLLLKLDRTL